MASDAHDQLLSCLEDVKLDLEEIRQHSSAIVVGQAIEEIERQRDALQAIYNARNAGDWVTQPLQWCAEVARKALYPESKGGRGE